MAPELPPEPEYEGPPSTFTCPECHGTLWELRDGELFRYRCHVGHAYTGETLSAAQDAELEAALWTALRTFEEHVTLLERMRQRVAARGSPGYTVTRLQQRAHHTRRRAEVLRAVLTDRDAAEPAEVAPSPNADA